MNARARTLVLAALAAVVAAPAQERSVAQLQQCVLDRQIDVEERCAALCALQDRGALDVATVVAAMADPDTSLGTAAAATVRHQWQTLSPELFAALDRSPAAAAMLLRELAIAPRPSAAEWARSWIARPGTKEDQKCLAMSASGQALTLADANLLLTALASGDVDDGFYAAAGLLAPKIADGLLGKLHALLVQQKVELSRMLPILDRLSPNGYERLLGLVVTLPPELGEELCLRLVQREVPAYTARAVAALEGKLPLEPLWLLRAGPLLVGTLPEVVARRERLLAVLGAADASEVLKARAFDALVDARISEQRMIDYAMGLQAERLGKMRRLLDVSVQDLPEARLVEWLEADPELARITVLSLVRRPALGALVEKSLVASLSGVEVVEGTFLEGAAQALLQHGSEASIDAVWPQLQKAPQFVSFLDTIARRKAPFVHELLLEQLAAHGDGSEGGEVSEAVLQRERDAVRLALCSFGDRRQLAELVAHAKFESPNFVRRCAHYATALEAGFAMTLLDDAARLPDDDLAAEMIGWAASSVAPEVGARLLEIWQAPELSERQEVALRALAAGPHRVVLQRDLCAAVAKGPLSERDEQVAYEVVSGMPSPLTPEDARVLAEFALRPPLADPVAERERAARWPDGRYGFPFLGAIAQRLRGTDPEVMAAAFAEVAEGVRKDPHFAAVSRQRLLVLWRSLEVDPAVMSAVARATAALLLAIPHPDGLGDGPANLFAMQVARAAGKPAVAAAHARAAVAGLLRLPRERRTARLFLGERDPGQGEDPWSALSAAPFLADAAAAQAAGDRVAAERFLALAREFVGRDADTAAAIESASKELLR
jgi:hypothetical protein